MYELSSLWCPGCAECAEPRIVHVEDRPAKMTVYDPELTVDQIAFAVSEYYHIAFIHDRTEGSHIYLKRRPKEDGIPAES